MVWHVPDKVMLPSWSCPSWFLCSPSTWRGMANMDRKVISSQEPGPPSRGERAREEMFAHLMNRSHQKAKIPKEWREAFILQDKKEREEDKKPAKKLLKEHMDQLDTERDLQGRMSDMMQMQTSFLGSMVALCSWGTLRHSPLLQLAENTGHREPSFSHTAAGHRLFPCHPTPQNKVNSYHPTYGAFVHKHVGSVLWLFLHHFSWF
ncbi:uncharacterized protein LOC123365293 [Mauremys mutica]|uniref:uncharacterized protein LOC123365293 n=1 Tax=Mauremys mutica TaxID=74926 RepID=UPI001D15623E|nr:uncharacterized protein LOC123365293 [Mauremys mutica]